MTPTQLRYDRLDLELYGDRLARHPARLTEEISAARLRLASYSLEREAHRELGAAAWAQLEAIGVISSEPSNGDEALVTRRLSQLAALTELVEFVELRIRDLQKAGR
jgi:hypothetical protein